MSISSVMYETHGIVNEKGIGFGKVQEIISNKRNENEVIEKIGQNTWLFVKWRIVYLPAILNSLNKNKWESDRIRKLG